MRQPKHWHDPINAVIGVWLVLSPWATGFTGKIAATANAVVVGLALVAAALGAMLVPRAWEEWTEAALGLWLIVSPRALGFSARGDAKFAAVGAGVVILVLALWTLATDRDYTGWLRDRKAR